MNNVDPSGLDAASDAHSLQAPPVPDAIRRALQIVHAANPKWTTRVSTWNSGDGWWDKMEAKHGGPVAGETGNGTSYIHTQRISRIDNPRMRFLKYLETVAHELYHQNNRLASEDEAQEYGIQFLKDWAKRSGNFDLQVDVDDFITGYQQYKVEAGSDAAWGAEHGTR